MPLATFRLISSFMLALVLLTAVSAYAMQSRTRGNVATADEVALPRMATQAEIAWMKANTDVRAKVATAPPTGPLTAVTEYQPNTAILFGYSGSTSWKAILAQMALQITTTGQTDVWVVASNQTTITEMTTRFTAAGVNMSRIRTFIATLNSIWMRDYGPRIIYEGGVRVVVDSNYYSSRPQDDVIPNFLAEALKMPFYSVNLLHSGGNYHFAESGAGFATRLSIDNNPSFTEAEIKELFRLYYGLVTQFQTQLPFSVDATGHIDMWFMPISSNKIMISSWPANVGSAQALTCDAAAVDMQSRGYTVYRVPARLIGTTHYTYVNSLFCNGLVLIPSYTNSSVSGYNAQAFTAWQAALPDKTIAAVACENIISAAGALHCIVQHVPTCTGGNNPAVYVRTANTAQAFVPSQAVALRWISDSVRTISSVDIQLSINGGATFTTIAANEVNDGDYLWTVPDVYTAQGRLRVVARDSLGNLGSDQNDLDFVINGIQQRNGDLDEDGLITNSDIALALLDYGDCATPVDCLADLDHSGSVDNGDIALFLLIFGDVV